MNDIDITRSCKMNNITEVAEKLNLKKDDLYLYGNYKAKILKKHGDLNGKLALVTAINPTPYGEGKTTVSIGLNDAINKINKKSVAVLRQPSMGPVFGLKGGATGGGYSQIVPMEDINLHFTGDFHAITSANNLLCAAIDNHIYFGNSLDIKKVTFNRCLDVNDRALRNVIISGRDDKFNITAASEIMAIFCLASSLEDLRNRLGNIIIGYNSLGIEVYARDLNIVDSLVILLKDAFLPNLVQSLENNPVIVHGGPFANIAHGCNSLVATKLGLSLSDYVITEAGFGSDLGAEKFFDIKCQVGNLKPSCVVLTATVRALKYNAGIKNENINNLDVDAVKRGLDNLKAHISNLKSFGVNFAVCLNKFDTDYDDEINVIKDYCKDNNVKFSVCESYKLGSDGCIDLANKVISLCDDQNNFKPLYKLDDDFLDKLNIICKNVYHASNIIFSEKAKKKILDIKSSNLSKLPICVSKTQYSISDDAKKIGFPFNYDIFVSDVEIYNGAGFIVFLMGSIIRMPGLPKKPNYEEIKFDKNYYIVGIK